MAYVVVWMDTDEAKFFSFTPGKITKDNVKIGASESKQAHDKDHHKIPLHFFQEITNKLKAATEVLVVGPGVSKTHFMHHIEKSGPSDLKKKIIGIENMDQLTDNQIVAHARKVFKVHGLFESI